MAKLGAHAIGVEESESADDWVVIAYVAPQQDIAAPAKLETTVRGKKVKVPLRIRREAMFKLE